MRHQASSYFKNDISKKLPRLFSDSSIMCAGSEVAQHGSCTGDSGGPLMHSDDATKQCKNIMSKNFTRAFVNRVWIPLTVTTA